MPEQRGHPVVSFGIPQAIMLHGQLFNGAWTIPVNLEMIMSLFTRYYCDNIEAIHFLNIFLYKLYKIQYTKPLVFLSVRVQTHRLDNSALRLGHIYRHYFDLGIILINDLICSYFSVCDINTLNDACCQ